MQCKENSSLSPASRSSTDPWRHFGLRQRFWGLSIHQIHLEALLDNRLLGRMTRLSVLEVLGWTPRFCNSNEEMCCWWSGDHTLGVTEEIIIFQEVRTERNWVSVGLQAVSRGHCPVHPQSLLFGTLLRGFSYQIIQSILLSFDLGVLTTQHLQVYFSSKWASFLLSYSRTFIT